MPRQRIIILITVIGILIIGRDLSFASVDIGTTGGINFSKLEAENGETTKSEHYKLAPILGIDLRAGKKFAFKTGLYFSMYYFGTKGQSNFIYDSTTNAFGSEEVDYSYKALEVPLLLDYINQSEKIKVHPHFSVGIITGCYLGCKRTDTYFDNHGNETQRNVYTRLNSPVVKSSGLFVIPILYEASIGFTVKVGHGTLNFDLQYDNGTTEAKTFAPLIGYSIPITAFKKK